MNLQEILDEIKSKPTVRVWPHLGVVFDCSRGQAYSMVARQDVDTIRIGNSIRVITSSLRKRLGLDAAVGDAVKQID